MKTAGWKRPRAPARSIYPTGSTYHGGVRGAIETVSVKGKNRGAAATEIVEGNGVGR